MRMWKFVAGIAVSSALFIGSVQAGQTPLTSGSNMLTSAMSAQQNETYTHKNGGIQFQLPKGWKAEPSGDQMTVSAPDNSIAMIFWVAGEDSLDATVKALGDELDKTMKKVKYTGEAKQDTHNDMPHYSQTGTGEIGGASILWSVDLLQAKKTVIILTFAAPGAFEKHAEDAQHLVMSIKKAS